MKKFKYFLIPIIIISIFTIGLNKFLDKKYEELKILKDIGEMRHKYNNLIRDRGCLLKDQMNSEGDLMLLGSSELSLKIDQNPVNMYPFKDANYNVSIYGRAYTQSLQHSATLSSTSILNKDSKVALFLSIQWFSNLSNSDFSANFSDLQFYKFFENDKLSNESKKYFAKRVSKFLKNSSEYEEEEIYARLYAKDDVISKSILIILKPYYKIKVYLLETKDKVQSIKELKKLRNKSNDENTLKEINWEEENNKAIEQGSLKITNNKLNVSDEYYNKYIKDNYEKIKGSWKDIDLTKDSEFEDYKFFLEVSKELGVKPLIVLIPVNGLYYDHLEWTVEKRKAFYSTLENLAKSEGFDVLNLQDKEYEKYYMLDAIHLGWKGWLDIDEKMYKYFQKK